MNRVIRNILTISFLFVFVTVNGQGFQDQSSKFIRLLRLIESFYVDTVNTEQLVDHAMVEMLSKLDPHSVYISKDEVERMNEPLKGSFEGIGISFSILRDTLMVLQTIPGGPSEKVGIVAGDRILFINDELVAGVGLTNKMVFDRLRGEKGSAVTVKIKRGNSNDLLNFYIIRGEIPIFSLDASYMIDNATGYIKLNRFSATTTDEFVGALQKLKKNSSFKNLVLDLRGNGGGFLKSAFEISDHFLDGNRMIVYTEGAKSPRKNYASSVKGEFENGKLVVLIDRGSASASEIVSGAVQDWDRGVVLGRRSFGKGLVQQPFDLPGGAQVRLTTAHYYTPSGRCIQKPYDKGVKEYQDDYLDRLESGELFDKDKISILDSVTYKTLVSGRKVYGGGGIIPDVFVPLDTSSNYRYYNKLVGGGVVNQFVINYIDKNRTDILKKYPQFQQFKSQFEISDKMLDELWNEGVKKDYERDEKSISFISSYAKRHIKAMIARDLWSSSEYYEVVNSKDDEIIEALNVLNTPGRYDAILKGQ